MEAENNMIVETLFGLYGASDEHMEEVLSAIPVFTERNMLSEWDGLPVKSRLPSEVEAAFKTRNQWEDQGVSPKDGARAVRMHPSPRAKRIFYYYHVSDTDAGETERAEADGRQVRVTIRVAAEVKKNLQRQAKESGMSVSEYIASLVMHPDDDASDEVD